MWDRAIRQLLAHPAFGALHLRAGVRRPVIGTSGSDPRMRAAASLRAPRSSTEGKAPAASHAAERFSAASRRLAEPASVGRRRSRIACTLHTPLGALSGVAMRLTSASLPQRAVTVAAALAVLCAASASASPPDQGRALFTGQARTQNGPTCRASIRHSVPRALTSHSRRSSFRR
jgi:hypothetical protein